MHRFAKHIRLFILLLCLSTSVESGEMKFAQLLEQHRVENGVVLQIGIDDDITRQLATGPRALIHCLERSAETVSEARSRLRKHSSADLVVEHWTRATLPHADNLVNLVVVNDNTLVPSSEVERVLRPGGVALCRKQDTFKLFEKPAQSSTDEWTHQWHGADGGLTTEDQQLGIPTGLQWLSGPLFAMAGRKSSTQTLVSVSGLNFYVTQNVDENVGKPVESMDQYLVATDAYNGMIRWKRRWNGPFVSGNGETNPRMIASPEMLYAVSAENKVVGIDPQTGIQQAEHMSKHTIEKIVLNDGMLLLLSKEQVSAVSANLTAHKWTYAGSGLSGLTIIDNHAFVLSSGRSSDGRFQHDLICLNTNDGKSVYEKNTQPEVSAARVRINFATPEFVALQAHGSLHMFESKSGKHLWTKSTEARPGKTYVDERYVGHFLRNGLVWMLMQNSPRESEGQNVWVGLNPRTGKQVKQLETQGPWPQTATPAKMGCQVLIASDRYIMIPRQSTFVDFETGEKHSFKFTRGGCGLGFVPANGLLYSHPHACGCFSEAIRGFMGMHSKSPTKLRSKTLSEDERLTVYRAPTVPNKEVPTRQWSTHRGDGRRGAFLPVELSQNLKKNWSIRIAEPTRSISGKAWQLRTGNSVTAATVRRNTAYVSDVNAGRLVAVDLISGKEQWEFQASGRVDSPPTIAQGKCVFGSHDGYVYCVDAKSGSPVWKYLAAPADRRIIAYSGLESAWPVAGATLVRDGNVYFAAGRAPDADGGIEVIGLKLDTGKAVWRKTIEGGSFKGLCDFPIDGEDNIFLSNYAFNPQTGENAEAADSLHLKGGKVGLLESSWSKHDLALRKDIQTWTAEGAAGQILAFSPFAKAAFNAESHKLIVDSDEHHEIELAAANQITSMAMTKDILVIAGGNDRSDPNNGGFLRLLDLHSGDIVDSDPLPAEANFDAVSIADSKVLVSTQDGFLHCFGE